MRGQMNRKEMLTLRPYYTATETTLKERQIVKWICRWKDRREKQRKNNEKRRIRARWTDGWRDV
eukprot:scaffold67547_cov17-Prasinocladus_malaysianus.AAC.1